MIDCDVTEGRICPFLLQQKDLFRIQFIRKHTVHVDKCQINKKEVDICFFYISDPLSVAFETHMNIRALTPGFLQGSFI